ncbi:MAG: hypothetical protein VR70_02390 [Rhodospirillaceae bacterium BRH_c57]|nr:MAG: hypothetical protein VR70_02390 [Rhodospirillaceae bacterium BRH_c57]
MSVYAAMSAAVSGMKAQSKSLGNISDNLANSQTVGFKRVDTSFSEMVTSSSRRSHSPGGVMATPRYRHSIQGDLTQTQIGTNMAVAGSGFFVVSKANSLTPQGVTFDSNSLFTRRGDFQLDKFGYLVNGGGYYLNGREVIDQSTLNTTDLAKPVRIETTVMQAQKTQVIGYSANLPAQAPQFKNPGTQAITDTTTAAGVQTSVVTISNNTGSFRGGDIVRVEVSGFTYEETITAAAATGIATEAEVATAITQIANDIIAAAGAGGDLEGLIDPAGVTVTPAGGAAPAVSVDLSMDSILDASFTVDTAEVSGGVATALATAQGTDTTALYSDGGSFSGGAVTVFNQTGTPIDIQFRWIRTATEGADLPQWALMMQNPNGSPEWTMVDTDGNAANGDTPFSFTNNGEITIKSLKLSNLALAGDEVTLKFTGSDDTPQLTSYYGDDISVYRLEQDGYQAGVMSDVFINDHGYVVANFDNGRSRVLYRVPLATFSAPEELARLDGGAFNRTPESGDPLVAAMGAGGAGTIVASATENSNVDIADEFIKMIVAQRAYSANSRSVTTADDMLQETLNMKR